MDASSLVEEDYVVVDKFELCYEWVASVGFFFVVLFSATF